MNLRPARITAWTVTTGESGMRTQARGLAQAVADVVVEKTLPRDLGWPRTKPGPFRPPWPDVVISCGRRSAAGALAVRKASGGRSLAVHVQDPRSRAGAFDLIVAMEHDDIAAGARVIKVPTALHDLTADNLAEAGRPWSARFAALGHPLTGVVIGGSLRGRAFTLADAERLIAALERVRAGADAGLAITPSRRTPADTLALLRQRYCGDPRVFLWNMTGDNPYRAILALSDRIVVTSDSVSMVSEALSTPHPVEVFDLGFARHTDFVQGLVDRGLARRFDGDPAPFTNTGPVNATETAAQALRALLQARTGFAG